MIIRHNNARCNAKQQTEYSENNNWAKLHKRYALNYSIDALPIKNVPIKTIILAN